ncbi:MAG TPA: carboxypeptidase regulatory-like domain-containing protein [Isosphaeraceae bacterium]|jgi:hypothetical protein
MKSERKAASKSTSPAVAALLLTVLASGSLLRPGPAAAAPPASAQAGFGTIKGRLVWGGSSAPESPLLIKQGDATVKDAAVCAAADLRSQELVVDPATLGVRYGFAYLNRPAGTNPEAQQAALAQQATVEIDQKNCAFIPHCTALLKDQALVFKSSDPVGHNVRYSGFTNASNNVALPPQGQLQVKLVAERRPLPLMCDIHPWMKGYMMIFDHPFFAVTGEDGSFEIQGVPAGVQKLVVWQEKVGYVNQGAGLGMSVTVQPGQTTDIGTVAIDPAKVKP